MIGRRGLKVQEYECGKKLVIREAWFGAKIAWVKEVCQNAESAELRKTRRLHRRIESIQAGQVRKRWEPRAREPPAIEGVALHPCQPARRGRFSGRAASAEKRVPTAEIGLESLALRMGGRTVLNSRGISGRLE